MELGNIIKKIRTQTGKSQTELAVFLGIAQNFLSRIENNQQFPGLVTLKKIGDKLEIPFPILIFLSMDEDDIPQNQKEAFKDLEPSINRLVNEFKLFYKIAD